MCFTSIREVVEATFELTGALAENQSCLKAAFSNVTKGAGGLNKQELVYGL